MAQGSKALFNAWRIPLPVSLSLSSWDCFSDLSGLVFLGTNLYFCFNFLYLGIGNCLSCSLGLATPTAIMVGTAKALKTVF